MEKTQIWTIGKSLLSPEIVFALVAMLAFSLTIVHPENILPEDLLPGTRDKQSAVIFSPEVLAEAGSMEPAKLLAAAKPDLAVNKAYELASKKPHDVIANISAGNVLVQLGELNEGFRLLKRSVALAPRSRYVRMNLADKLTDKERYEEALNQYKLISQAYPHWSKPRLKMAEIYLETNNPAAAADELKEALQAEPNNYRARKERGIALARIGKNQIGFEEFFLGESNEVNQQGFPADIKQQQTNWGTLDRAIYELNKQLEQRPDDHTVKLALARIYMYTGNNAEAKRLLTEARKKAPKDWQIHRSLAYVLNKLGDEGQALNEFSLSVKLEMEQERMRQEK